MSRPTTLITGIHVGTVQGHLQATTLDTNTSKNILNRNCTAQFIIKASISSLNWIDIPQCIVLSSHSRVHSVKSDSLQVNHSRGILKFIPTCFFHVVYVRKHTLLVIDCIPIFGEPMARAMMLHVETTSIGQLQEPGTKQTVYHAQL